MALTFDQPWSTECHQFCGGPDTTDGCQTCVISSLLPCVQYGLNTQKLSIESGAPFATNCCGAGCVWYLLYVLPMSCVFVPCHCLIHMQTRAAIRRKYNLRPEPCGDCCMTFCCPACALCQEHYQITGPHNGVTAKAVTAVAPNKAATPAY